MKLTNEQIYLYGKQLYTAFSDVKQQLPVKLNFYIQKNKNTLRELSNEIEQSRKDIVYKYGEANEETGDYSVLSADKKALALQELQDLLSLEQEVQIYLIDLNAFEQDVNLTVEQMDAILFMIQE